MHKTGGTESQWQVTALTTAPNPNTYIVQNKLRAGACYDLLSSYLCGYGYPNTLSTYNQVGNSSVMITCFDGLINLLTGSVSVLMRPIVISVGHEGSVFVTLSCISLCANSPR